MVYAISVEERNRGLGSYATGKVSGLSWKGGGGGDSEGEIRGREGVNHFTGELCYWDD